MIVYEGEGFSYIKISELPVEERNPFQLWMTGQTAPLIEGIEMDNLAFTWDYTRWKARRK